MQNKSRTSNSIRNGAMSILYNCVVIAIAFIAQSIFIKTLGAEYNGVKSLFQNIVTMLSIAELGFGNAIVYRLYKPLLENNEEETKRLLLYYKKVYTLIATFIFFVGGMLTVIIPRLVGNTTITDNIYIIYLLFLLNTVLSYFMSYKRAILYADQKNYIINIFDMLFAIAKNILQTVVLIITKNFIVYLIVQILLTLLQNFVIYIYVNKKYAYLNVLYDASDLDIETKNDIKTSVNGLLFHKLGAFFVTGTDNILISLSSKLGILYVGLYSNYNMIITNVANIFGGIINSVTASVGNLLAEFENNNDRKYTVYKNVLLVNNWIFTFGAISIFILADDFISMWIGNEYLLSKLTLFVLVLSFYFNGLKRTSNAFKEAAGIFYTDRFIPILESVVNLVFSILLMNLIGLPGVFLGTILSSFVLLFYGYPKYVYTKMFDKSFSDYYKLYFMHILHAAICFIITYIVCMNLKFNSVIASFVIKILICGTVPNFIYYLLVRNTGEFAYVKNIVSRRKK